MSRAHRRHSQPKPNSTIQPHSNSSAAPQKKKLSFTLKSFQEAIFFLFNILLFVTPFIFTWVNEELFEFNKMLFAYSMTVLILGVWVARMIYHQKIIFRRTLFDIPILLFVGSQLISTLFSIHIPTSIFGYYTRFHGGLLSTLTYVCLFYAAVSNLEKKHLPGLLLSTFSSALLTTVLAIPEHFGRSFSCLLINTNQQVAQNSPGVWGLGNLWANYNVACWIQDVQDRVFSTFGQPNWLAAYAITLIPVSMVVADRYYLNDMLDSAIFTLKQRKVRVFFYSLVSILLFVTLLFTKSRSGFLGFAASMIVLGVVEAWHFLQERKTSSITRKNLSMPFLVCLVGFAVCSLYFGTPYSPGLTKHLGRPTSTTEQTASPAEAAAPVVNRLEVGGTDSAEIRRIVWQGAVKVWQRYPLFGSGVETFAYSYYLDRPLEHNHVSEWDFLYNKAHNEWLNYLATTGTVGILTYLGMLGVFIGVPAYALIAHFNHPLLKKITQHTWVTDTETSFPTSPASISLSVAMSAGLIALTISNFFGFSTVMVGILLFLFPAFFVLLATKDLTLAPVKEKATATQIVGLVFVGLATLWLLLSLRTTWLADKYYAVGKGFNQAGQISEAFKFLQEAVRLSPNEDVYKEELSVAYARAAVVIAEQTKDATAAGQVAKQAVDMSNQVIASNPVHLNFYKTKARVLLTLAPLSDQFIWQARDTLLKARTLAPTDPKIIFNLAIIELSVNLDDEGFAHLQEAVKMKPNYEAARISLAEEFEKRAQYQAARQQYEYILQNIQSNSPEASMRLARIESGSATFGPKATPVKVATDSAKTPQNSK